MKNLPVYSIKDFRNFSEEDAFYSSGLKIHIRDHDFTNKPHKHEFYTAILFTSGKGTHEIDFKKYVVKPGSLFFMKPGQMHNWKLSADCDGFIFFHTRSFYDEGFMHQGVQDYSFYSSGYASPLLYLKGTPYLSIKDYFSRINEEYRSLNLLKLQKLHALVNLVYIEAQRIYAPSEQNQKQNYLDKLKRFEDLLDQHFRQQHSAAHYAGLMHLSEKHLNRISKTTVNKTSTELIADRIVLEARRLLMHGKLSVTQIADQLGFKDNSYFTRFFKKHTGETPLGFLNAYKGKE